MEIVLVCIAKDEDNYIKEWVDYHLKLGFNHIFIYENDWDSKINDERVSKIPVKGAKQQIPSYNNFIQNNKSKYDWAAFLDVDEFLVLKKHKNIHEFIEEYQNEDAIGINWVFFGNNGHDETNNDYSLIKRFTKRGIKPNEHIKTIVKLDKCNTFHVHHHSGKCVDSNRKRIDNTPFNPNGPIDIIQINHYFAKTKGEFTKKINRGRADTGTFRDMSDFNGYNLNEIEDLTAYNFYYNDNNNLLDA
jgi:hypothetical protein